MASAERLAVARAEDGLLLNGALFESCAPRDSLLLWVHGFGVGYDYPPCIALGRAVAARGISFLAAGNRGEHGGVTGWLRNEDGRLRTRKVGSWFEDVTESPYDLRAWLRFARELGFAKVIVAGHSFGAVKLAYWLAIDGCPADGIVLASPSRGTSKLDPELVLSARAAVAGGRGGLLLPEGSWPRGFGTTTVSARTMVGWADAGSTVFEHPESWQGAVGSVPVLAYYGDSSDVGDLADLEWFTRAMAAPVTVEILPGVTHNYSDDADRIADAITQWWHPADGRPVTNPLHEGQEK